MVSVTLTSWLLASLAALLLSRSFIGRLLGELQQSLFSDRDRGRWLFFLPLLPGLLARSVSLLLTRWHRDSRASSLLPPAPQLSMGNPDEQAQASSPGRVVRDGPLLSLVSISIAIVLLVILTSQVVNTDTVMSSIGLAAGLEIYESVVATLSAAGIGLWLLLIFGVANGALPFAISRSATLVTMAAVVASVLALWLISFSWSPSASSTLPQFVAIQLSSAFSVATGGNLAVLMLLGIVLRFVGNRD